MGIASNVVDGPISWRAVPADPLGTEENGSFWSRKACGGTRAGPPDKTMPVYYDEFDIPDHDCIFLNIASALPAVLQARNLLWLKVGDSS